MIELKIIDNWDLVKEKLKQEYGYIKIDNIKYVSGKE